MKILFAASEGAPFIKTGGLGDVIYALPEELGNNKDLEISIFLPYYRKIKQNPNVKVEYVTDFLVPLSWRNQYCGLYKKEHPTKKNITYYFIDNDRYFDRDTIYGHFDDGERFAFYSKAILEAILHLDFTPDVIHCHDWQTALIPIWLKANFCHMERFQRIKTVFTIHNIEYQGAMPLEFFYDTLGLHSDWLDVLSYDGAINFMKGAIVLADKVTTVSRTYSHEIRHAYFAHGLHNVLQEYGYKVTGIVNGIDTDLYNAQKDPALFENFEAGDLSGKAKNKTALQEKVGLPVDARIPMVAMITRLADHKGLDLVKYVADEIMELPLQFVVLGTGQAEYEELFHRLAWEHPDKMSANITFDTVFANQLYAAADIFLMPSKSEPCGLSQLIAMRYGTIPVVRETGGLYDTVPALDPETMEGRGFTFKSYNAHDMLASLKNAVQFYDDKVKLHTLVTRIMETDFSWKEPVKEYLALYESL